MLVQSAAEVSSNLAKPDQIRNLSIIKTVSTYYFDFSVKPAYHELDIAVICLFNICVLCVRAFLRSHFDCPGHNFVIFTQLLK